MRFAFLADGSLGAPALAFLASTGALAGAAWGPSDPACRDWAGQQCAAAGVAFRAVGTAAELLPWLEEAQPDLAFSFGCPWKLGPEVLARPRLGWINLHGGPLPAYRGPQPVFWQIRNGEKASALVAHRMDAGFDSGPVLAVVPIQLPPACTHGALTQALAQVAPALLDQLLRGFTAQGEAYLDSALPQGEGRIWPRPGPEDVRIDWTGMDGASILALVRACNPWNSGAWTLLQGQPCRVVEAAVAAGPAEGPPGFLQGTPEGGLAAACRDGSALRLDILRLEEGFYTGAGLRSLGLGPGARLG